MFSGKPAPVVLFAYNRLNELKQTVEALQQNTLAEKSRLFIFSDGPADKADEKAVLPVRGYLRAVSGFKDVVINEADSNLGLSESIISGTGKMFEEFDKVIVVEDDLQTSPYFLQYMNDALDCYSEQKNVASISGYGIPFKAPGAGFYFLPGAFWWGWGTWKDRWRLFNKDGKYLLDELKKRGMTKAYNIHGSFIVSPEIILKKYIKGKLDTWAMRWHASMLLANKYTLYPSCSFVNNIGLGSGMNCRVKSNCLSTPIADKPVHVSPLPVEVKPQTVRKIKKFYLKAHLVLLRDLMKKIIAGKINAS